jgi:hypothetical protein
MIAPSNSLVAVCGAYIAEALYFEFVLGSSTRTDTATEFGAFMQKPASVVDTNGEVAEPG